MKRSTLINILIAWLFVTIIFSCKKSVDNVVSADSTGTKDSTNPASTQDTIVPYPQTINTHCQGAPDYGDSIIFTQPASGDYIVKPINNPDTGKYFSWPTGMAIDQNTGAIDVSKSEGGLRYSIGYVKKGTADTCMQTLILAGASYEDSVYVVNDDERYAKPYFNADPNLVSICSSNGGPNSCTFDVNGQAASLHIIIDKNTGIIDLKNTLNQGAFGLLPVNGATIKPTITYKLNDNSNMALQQITVEFVYYNKKSDVPASLLAAVTDKLDKILNQLLLINLQGASGRNNGNPRPPIIIVTRFD
jgi:hypothetical protein